MAAAQKSPVSSTVDRMLRPLLHATSLHTESQSQSPYFSSHGNSSLQPLSSRGSQQNKSLWQRHRPHENKSWQVKLNWPSTENTKRTAEHVTASTTHKDTTNRSDSSQHLLLLLVYFKSYLKCPNTSCTTFVIY
jgi:hypothetical protein